MSIFGKRIITAVAMAAVLAVSEMPLTAAAQVLERPPEIPESELIKQPEIPAAWQGDGAQKPQGSDFTWVYDVENIFNVPAGATVLDMFASGDAIKDFIIVNMYQIGDRQYALGIFSADNEKSLGNVYMTRQIATSVGTTTATTSIETTTTPPGSDNQTEGNKAISISFRDLNWFSGYWAFEDSNSSDSMYIEPVNDHQAYVVIADEACITRQGGNYVWNQKY